MWDPGYGDTQIFGVGGAFVSGVVLLALGVVLAAVCRFAPSTRDYFLQQPAAAYRRAARQAGAVGCWNEPIFPKLPTYPMSWRSIPC